MRVNWTQLRIAIVGPLPPPMGGMATQTAQLAALLGAEGAAVEVVQVNAAYRPHWVARLRGIRALLRLLPYVGALWRACGRVDVVHVMANSGIAWFVFAVPALLVARLRGRSVVVNYRGGAADAFLSRAAWAVRPVMRLASSLVVPSGFLVEVFARHGMHAGVVSNIVDTARFTPAQQKSDAGAPHLVVTRNLEAIYDIATALKAFALVHLEFPSAVMTIAGEGPLRAQLEAQAAQLGIAQSVTFAGRIDNASIPALYRRAHVFLNPSRVDNMPNSVLEALASGVPVVSTNVGGVPFMVEQEQAALLVAPGDAEAMARAVVRVLRDQALAARLSAAGLEATRRREWPAIRPVLLSVYLAALRRESPAPARVA